MSDVKVAFLTDSCSDIPQELTDKYGIDVIGFHIMLDGKEYLERKDMTNDQFYEMMRPVFSTRKVMRNIRSFWLCNSFKSALASLP